MFPPNLFHQIHPSLYEQNYCTPPKCSELSEYTESAKSEEEEEELSSRCMNGSDVYDRTGHGTRQFHPSCTS